VVVLEEEHIVKLMIEFSSRQNVQQLVSSLTGHIVLYFNWIINYHFWQTCFSCGVDNCSS